MRVTKDGWDQESYFGSNDMSVVHWRFLHKLMRKVPRFNFSNIGNAKFIDDANLEKHNSKYGVDTYSWLIKYQTPEHEVKSQEVNPYIDDQIDKHFNDVVKPRLESLESRVGALENELSNAQNRISALESQVSSLESRGN